jgi:tripartite-type tricarboxylate transporter receptor subunit TctC
VLAVRPISARLIGQWLSERLGQPFIIENRPVAAAISAPRQSCEPSDGHTLLMAGTFNAINATLYEKLKFNFMRDIAPVASVVQGGLAVGEPIGSGQYPSCVHRVCQAQSRQN